MEYVAPLCYSSVQQFPFPPQQVHSTSTQFLKYFQKNHYRALKSTQFMISAFLYDIIDIYLFIASMNHTVEYVINVINLNCVVLKILQCGLDSDLR